MHDNGFYQMSPAFTAKGLESIRGSIKRGLANAEKNEIEVQKGNTLLNSRQTLLSGQDPTEVSSDLLRLLCCVLMTTTLPRLPNTFWRWSTPRTRRVTTS